MPTRMPETLTNRLATRLLQTALKSLGFICLFITTAVVHAQDPAVTIIKAVDKITIDGKLEEKTWDMANTWTIDWIFGGAENAKESLKPRGVVQYAWDQHYFYIAYRVFDDNLVNLDNGKKEGPGDNPRIGLLKYHKKVKVDFAMFLISFGSHNFVWEIDHNASNNFNDIWVVVPEKEWPIYNSTLAGKTHVIEQSDVYIKDHNELNWDTGEQGVFRLKTAAKLLKHTSVSRDNSRPDKDKGYVGEIRIPWEGLGAPKTAKRGFDFHLDGQVIRVLAVTRNGDLATPYHASTKLDRGFVHKQVDRWPAFTLRK